MKFIQLVALFAIICSAICVQKMNAENADENDMEAKVQAPQMLSSILPNLLPPGPLNKRTIECINSTFDQIQRDNPHLVPWLSDVQETAVKLHTKLRQCNKLEKNLQSGCILTWNQEVGGQFLRLGLLLLSQNNRSGNQLDVVLTFLREFQKCW